MFKERLAVIIPTKDRPDGLFRLLENITLQNIKPSQIIVVDGGIVPAKTVVDKFSGLRIIYRKTPPSLTLQRNIGIRMLPKEITIVSFFDDDIILKEDALRNMMEFWEKALPEVGGTAYSIISEAYVKPNFFEKLFFVNTEKPGKVMKSGFLSQMSSLKEITEVQWLSGCATAWRRHIFNEFMYDERFSGYGRHEDADFSYRVGKKYKLYVVTDAKVEHLKSKRKEDAEFSYALGKMQIVNTYYFVMKNKELSRALSIWSLFGLFLNNAIKGIVRSNVDYINCAKGNLAGFKGLLSGKIFDKN